MGAPARLTVGLTLSFSAIGQGLGQSYDPSAAKGPAYRL